MAARTRIAVERIEAIERGRVALADDALGRGAARQLVLAIGSDPAQAFARLRWTEAPAVPVAAAAPPAAASPWLWVAGIGGLVLAAALLYGGARWLDRGFGRADPSVVYRPDYVEDLLTRRDRTQGS